MRDEETGVNPQPKKVVTGTDITVFTGKQWGNEKFKSRLTTPPGPQEELVLREKRPQTRRFRKRAATSTKLQSGMKRRMHGLRRQDDRIAKRLLKAKLIPPP